MRTPGRPSRNVFDFRSIRMRLSLAILVFIILITGMLQTYTLKQFEQASTLNLMHEGLLLSDTLAAAVLPALAMGNFPAIQDHINRLVENREINDIEINIMVLDGEGSYIAASNVPDNIEAADIEEHQELIKALAGNAANIFFEMESDDEDIDDVADHELEISAGANHPDDYFQANTRYMSITMPLATGGQSLGGINVKLSLHPLDAKLARIRGLLMAATAGTTLVALLGLGYLLNRKIFIPIRRMQEDMNLVAAGNLDLPIAASHRSDEIGQLARSFGFMAAQLKKTQVQLHQYLNPMAIREAYRRARETRDGPRAEEKEISVMFIDIVAFTTTAERLGPTATVTYLNDFYERISDALLNSGGYIDKFVADELICVFEGSAHADNAVNTARKVLDRMSEFDDCRIRIGINTGHCIIADIGSRQAGRLDRTIIGDAVNVAQRLMTIADPNSAILSLGTRRALRDQVQDIIALAPQKLKGKAFPVKAFLLSRQTLPQAKTTAPVGYNPALAIAG